MCIFVLVCKDQRINMLCVCMHPPTHVDVHMYFSEREYMCVCVYICADGMLIERPRDGVGRCYNISFFHYLSLWGFVMQMHERVGDSKCQDFKIFFLSFFQEQSDEVS